MDHNRFVRIEGVHEKSKVSDYLNLTLDSIEAANKCNYQIVYYNEQSAHKVDFVRIVFILEKIKGSKKKNFL